MAELRYEVHQGGPGGAV